VCAAALGSSSNHCSVLPKPAFHALPIAFASKPASMEVVAVTTAANSIKMTLLKLVALRTAQMFAPTELSGQ
jgi:hypothetical protein